MRGSLRPAFALVRLVCLTIKLACAFVHTARFPSALSQPLYDSVTFLESTSPVKLPTRQCFVVGFLCDNTIRVNIFKERCSIVVHGLRRDSLLPSTVKNVFPVSSYSKAPRGLFVHVCVGRIFTAISISPGNSSRQLLSRSTFRAGRNLPDKELRYHRTVIVTAAIHSGLSKTLDIISDSTLDLRALGRCHPLYVAFRLCRELCFS